MDGSSEPSGKDVRIRPITALLAAALAMVLALSGCSAPPTIARNSAVTVATSQAFFSYNDRTSYGHSAANSAIVQATNSSFNYYDTVPRLVEDTSFGSYQVLAGDPLTVKYTISDGVKWSDGTRVDAADLLLAWAANSGTRNTPGFDDGNYVDPDTGQFTADFPRTVVFFDGATSDGLQLVTKTPVIGDDGRSLTLSWDKFFVDWRLLLNVGLPAHVVAGHALNIADSDKAKKALITAIQDDDTTALAALSRFWNSGFNFTSMPTDRELLIGTGPYTITDFIADDHLILTANPNYVGDHKPVIERITVRFISDPLSQVRALRDGSVDVAAPQASADVSAALTNARRVTVARGFEGSYEHLDLQVAHSKSGLFGDRRVRAAFLKVVPRRQILRTLIWPAQKNAPLRSSQLFLPGEPGYTDSIAGNGSARYAEVDVAGAKALLAEAGLLSPTVCILFDGGNPRRLKEFQLIQHSAAQAGFVVTDCSSPDWLNLLGTSGAYDASLFAWTASNLSAIGSAAIFGTAAKSNDNFYSNLSVDALFSQLRLTADSTRQTRLRQRIDRLLWADAYGVPLYQFPAVAAFDPGVTGVAPSPLSPGILWNLWEWKPKKSR